MMLSVLALTAVLQIQVAKAQESVEKWPGVFIKVLTENEFVKVFEVTWAPGAVADWHDHPNHTLYAVTDIKISEELKGKGPTTVELKAGQAAFANACTHKTTSLSKNTMKVIVTEIKK